MPSDMPEKEKRHLNRAASAAASSTFAHFIIIPAGNIKSIICIHNAEQFLRAPSCTQNVLTAACVPVLRRGPHRMYRRAGMGHRNNQSFVQVPFARFRRILQTVCVRYGICVILQEESYTSKACFALRALCRETARSSRFARSLSYFTASYSPSGTRRPPGHSPGPRRYSRRPGTGPCAYHRP